MIAELLEKWEPVVYASLKNDLVSRQLAHVYLFSGQKNPLKKETAFLLAQSIIEDRGDFACEVCSLCRRVKEGHYYDLIYLDGYEQLIKKDDVARIMDEFARTSLEASGKKIYIIANVNNSTDKVLNMLLKFMEEPASENVYGIFITDEKDKLLETVISRCKVLNFRCQVVDYLTDEYQKRGFERADSYFLADYFQEVREFSLNDRAYIEARDTVDKLLEVLADGEYLPILFGEYYNRVGRDLFKESSDYFLALMLRLLSDAVGGYYLDDEVYDKRLRLLRKYDLSALFAIFEEAYEASFLPVNRLLLFDRISYKIISLSRSIII